MAVDKTATWSYGASVLWYSPTGGLDTTWSYGASYLLDTPGVDTSSELLVTIPSISFLGSSGLPTELVVDIPIITSSIYMANTLAVDFPAISAIFTTASELDASIPLIVFSILTGETLDASFPVVTFSAQTGATVESSLYAISSSAEALGTSGIPEIIFPSITFSGKTNVRSWLGDTFPPITAQFNSGATFPLELSAPTIVFEAFVGSVGSLQAELPELVFASKIGAALGVELPVFGAQSSATVGTVSTLNSSLLSISASFDATVNNLGQLLVSIPVSHVSLSSRQQILGNLVVESSPLSALFSGSAGEVATLNVTIPEITAQFSSVEDITLALAAALSGIKAYLEASHPDRFNTDTQTEFDTTILKYRRPS